MSKPPPRSPRSRRPSAQRIEDLAAASGAHTVEQTSDSSQMKIIAIVVAIAIVFLLLLLFLLLAGAGAMVAMSGSGGGSGSGMGSGNAAGQQTADGAGQPSSSSASSASGDEAGENAGAGNAAQDAAESSESEQSSQAKGGPPASTPVTPAANPMDSSAENTDSQSNGSGGGEQEETTNASSNETVDLSKKPAPPPSMPLPSGRVITIPGGEFFGIRSEGKSFIYIIDCSPSMWEGNRFNRAKTEVIRSVSSLVEEQEFFVYFFDEREYGMYYPSGMQGGMVPATAANKQKLAEWVRKFETPYQGTDPSTALVASLKMDPEVIFLLSDGDFNYSVIDLTTRSNTNRTRINTVSFVTKEGEPLLRRIAEQNRGKYLFVP